MDEETFNMTLRKFLKRVGVTSQHEIEEAVRQGLASGKLAGTTRMHAKMTLVIDELGLRHEVEDDIALS